MRKHVKLRALMVEPGDDGEHLARALMLGRTALSYRMNAKYPWTSWEMWTIMRRYNVPADQMHLVFPEYETAEHAYA